MVVGAAATLAVVIAQRAGAQVHRLTYARDTAFDLTSQGVRRGVTMLVRKDGYMVVAPEYFYGEAMAFDSSFKKQSWRVSFGRGLNSEIGWVTQWGWAGDSVWVVDGGYQQVALIGSDGKIARSIAFPSWIRPFWGDRRRYPLFSRMNWHAVFSDGTLLVEPYQVRRLFDTPGYDPDQKLLVRIDRDGRILRTVARAPLMEGRLLLRSGAERKTWNVPSYPRTFWKTSADGERVAVVSPIPSDSGAFMVTLLNGQGDTVFSRRYAVDAWRVATAPIDTLINSLRAFGRYSEQQVRDTIRKLVPRFHSPVGAVSVGIDYSVWVALRRPSADQTQTEWMVIDEKGDVVGTSLWSRVFKLTAPSVDRIWTIEYDRVKQKALVVRYRRSDARAVRPARSASSSGSSSPARPRE